MRGFPFLQVCLIGLLFAAAGLPVWQLTRADTTSRPELTAATLTGGGTPPPPVQTIELKVEAVFSPAPADFEVRSAHETVLTGAGPETRFTKVWRVSLPAEGADLVFAAHWPAAAPDIKAGPAAAQLSVSFPDKPAVRQTFWVSSGEPLQEVVSLPGAHLADPVP